MQIRSQKSRFIITHSDYGLDDRMQSVIDRPLRLFLKVTHQNAEFFLRQ